MNEDEELKRNGWIKSYSKTYKADYWFNTNDGTRSWTMPEMNSTSQGNSKRTKIEDRNKVDEEPNPSSKVNLPDLTMEHPVISIIVPFRDLHVQQQRGKQLKIFTTEMSKYLNDYSFKLVIVEQSNDNRKFNRGKLLNVGFDQATKLGCNVFIFHDVDLIPSLDLLPYYTQIPKRNPIHIASVWNRYNNNEKYFGGVVSFSKEMFININGFPNNFWGWGGEDDELYNRIKEKQLSPIKPTEGGYTDLEEMNLEQKLKFLKESDVPYRCMNRYELFAEHQDTWMNNGYNQLRYEILQTNVTNIHPQDTSNETESTKQSTTKTQQIIHIVVDLGLNNHWTDAKCGINEKGQIPPAFKTSKNNASKAKTK